MDLLVSKIKVAHVNRKSASQREIYPFTTCAKQEIVKVMDEKWALSSYARLSGDVTVCVTAASAFCHAGVSMNLLFTDLHVEGTDCGEYDSF